MNTSTYSGFFSRLRYRAMLGARSLGRKTSSESFGAEEHHDAIQRIYVINLDREPDRWRHMSRELRSLYDRSGKPLTAISRRFSAVDARYYKGLPNSEVIQPHYSLADQLFVQPDPLLDGSINAQARRIEMTPQEVAVALSHVEVWKLISESDRLYALVLGSVVIFAVIPAKAGIQRPLAANVYLPATGFRVPAFAGMTETDAWRPIFLN